MAPGSPAGSGARTLGSGAGPGPPAAPPWGGPAWRGACATATPEPQGPSRGRRPAVNLRCTEGSGRGASGTGTRPPSAAAPALSAARCLCQNYRKSSRHLDAAFASKFVRFTHKYIGWPPRLPSCSCEKRLRRAAVSAAPVCTVSAGPGGRGSALRAPRGRGAQALGALGLRRAALGWLPPPRPPESPYPHAAPRHSLVRPPPRVAFRETLLPFAPLGVVLA